MKVSLIATVLNEEGGIEKFIKSILSQSRLPDEIVLVDGGSTDRTVSLIEQHLAGDVPVRLIINPGCNISEGRNRAVREASFDVLAVTDAGCLLEASWLEEITAPMESNPAVDVVAGSYRVSAQSRWERVTSAYLMPCPDRISPGMPSGRSTCFRRSAWEAAGGYPEWLRHAEDSYFARELARRGSRFHFAPGAIVRWKPRSTPWSFFKQYFRYAVGDGKSELSTRHYLLKIMLYLSGLILALAGKINVLLFLIALYVIFVMVRYLVRGKERHLLWMLPPVIFLHDIAQVTGYIFGTISGGSET